MKVVSLISLTCCTMYTFVMQAKQQPMEMSRPGDVPGQQIPGQQPSQLQKARLAKLLLYLETASPEQQQQLFARMHATPELQQQLLNRVQASANTRGNIPLGCIYRIAKVIQEVNFYKVVLVSLWPC